MILEHFKVAIEDWVERLLTPYLRRLGNRAAGENPKEFNDPVWGTIVLRPLEVVLVDSPLLQRLRFVRQLGVVHLVYPAANHSRLEHTIGVLHQVDRLVESFNDHFAAPGPAIDPRHSQLLRVTALCHDIGHGAMSHVSENALDNFSDAQQLRADFSDEVGGEEAAIGEIVSYYAVGSPAFGRLLAEAQRLADEHLMQGAVGLIQNAIVGNPIDDRVPLMHELISGPFDADKLDYMTRDAFMTGVPVVTDIPRLVQKVRAVELREDELPAKVAERVVKGRPSYVMTGIQLSGGRTLDELMFGQVLLHDKLYRHSKVRAAEAMVASIFREIGDLVPGGPAMMPYMVQDHHLMDLSLEGVRHLARRSLTPQEERRAKVAIDLSRRLRDRNLFVRAFAFALHMPLDPFHADAEHYDGLEEVVRNSDEYEFRGALVGRIASEAERICDLVAPDVLAAYRGDLKPYIWLDPPVLPRDTTDSLHAYLIAEHRERREVLPFTEGIAGASRWSEAYLLTRDTGYIFAPEDLSVYVHIASEVVFRRDHGIRTPLSMRTYAKQAPADLDGCRAALYARGYYDGLPYDIRPLARRLTAGDIPRRIQAVRDNLHGYEAPVGARADKGPPLLSEERIAAWLSQFRQELQDEPLKLLEELRLIDRKHIVATLERFVSVHGEMFQGAAVAPLGTAKDSSVIAAYYANDLQGVAGLDVLALAEALSADRPIIFIDDFIGSGQQSVSILEAWMGEEPTTALHEDRGEPLSRAFQEALRTRPLGFAFAAGMRDGVELLERAAHRLKLEATVLLNDAPPVPQAFAGELSPRRAALREDCKRIGAQLLIDDVEDHDETWRADRILGYGNRAFLIASSYNTPTQALTCLWKAGTVDGIDWLPLLPRRPKL